MSDLVHLFAITEAVAADPGYVSFNKVGERYAIYARSPAVDGILGRVGQRVFTIDELRAIGNALIARAPLLLLGAGLQIVPAADRVTFTLASTSPPYGNGETGSYPLTFDDADQLGAKLIAVADQPPA